MITFGTTKYVNSLSANACRNNQIITFFMCAHLCYFIRLHIFIKNILVKKKKKQKQKTSYIVFRTSVLFLNIVLQGPTIQDPKIQIFVSFFYFFA